MTSATLSEKAQFVRQPSISIVEQVPNIPELNQWLLIEQRRKTQLFREDSEWHTSSLTKIRQNQDSLTQEAKIKIITNANDSITSGVKDLDPDIRKLVNRNFKDLLWK